MKLVAKNIKAFYECETKEQEIQTLEDLKNILKYYKEVIIELDSLEIKGREAKDLYKYTKTDYERLISWMNLYGHKIFQIIERNGDHHLQDSIRNPRGLLLTINAYKRKIIKLTKGA